MPQRFRSLNRFAVALALVAVFAGARVGVQMFAAPTVSFETLPNLNFNQGQPVTVAFAAIGFPTGVTYDAHGLPAGLSMSMGVDTLGHVVGIMSGTLAADTPAASGSEGQYNVSLTASDGAVSNTFTIDVSHWNQGDVFVGGGQWVYQVYRDDASFKTNVKVPDDANLTFGSTTGCAVNWRTGEVWATNFDSVYPAVNVITRHSGNNPLPYTDPSRRLSTERYGPGNVTTPSPGNMNPYDENPESVAFNNNGDMMVGHSFGYFNDNGDVAGPDGSPIVLEDPVNGWVYVDAAGLSIVDIDGNMFPNAAPISPAGFFEQWIVGAQPFNILGPNHQPIAVPIQGGMDMHRYIADANGNYQTENRQFYDFHYGHTGIDTLDLLSDQKTMNYSSEDWYIYRYDISADKQMPVLGSSVLGESRPISTRFIYGIRALPPGDGTGGYLAVNESHIDRLDQNGHIIQTYDVNNDPDYAGGNADGWFTLAIAPGGRSFWAGTRQDVFHFDIASGALIGTKIHATALELGTNAELSGLCVMDEYRAAQEVCGPTGLGNGIDDDHDGTIDEGCFRVETCSPFSPGDDDGDGLIDYNDPDCGAVPAQQCNTTGPTDNSVAGICNRSDYEGDNVVVPGIPLPCVGEACNFWTFNFSAAGLPPGLTLNPATGEVTGVPFFSIVNPNSELSAPVVFHVTVNSTWVHDGGTPASFANSFDWTIYNRNRAPVAVDDGIQTVNAGGNFSFDVRFNDSDIDGDNPLTIVSFTQPPTGQGSVTQSGQNLVYTAPLGGFSGLTSFTYIIKDTYNPAAESNVATVRVRVNNLPLAVNDSYVTPKNIPLIASVAGNDTPSIDGGNVWTVTAQPSSGLVVMLPTGGFTYTPALNFTGTVTFNYKVCDIDNDCANAVATIKINDVPLAVNDSFTTPLNTALTASVTGNDTPSGDTPNTWTKLTNPSHGGVTMTAAGGFTYTPNANYSGLDSFTYKVCDLDNDCSNATVTIKINDVPKAVNDSYTTPKNTLLAGSVTGNDTPSLDIPNVWTVTTAPTSGLLVLLPTGAFTYTPALNFTGTVTFNYKVCDIDNDCANAIATIKINDVPLAVNDSFTTALNTALTASVTGNDTPSADTPNTWTKLTNPAHGTATMTAAGGFTYTPATNYSGPDSFTYNVCDVDNDCATATVTIRINDVPKAVNDSYTTPKNTPLVASVTGNDTPSLDIPNVWSLVTGPTSGLLVFLPTGGFTYTPALLFSGTVTFTYKVCDIDNDCANAVATIKINDAPVAVNDSFTTPKNTALTASVTGNDTPSADAPNTWTKVGNPSHGTVTMTAAGGFTYTPTANYAGLDSFTYKVCDADNDCANATVSIKINDVPLAVNDSYTTPKNTALTASVAGNDTASLDAPNTWTVTTAPTSGAVVLNTNGTFTYTPATGFTGTVTFNYRVCDVDNDCANAIATIRISDVPLAVNDSYTTPKNTALTASVAGNDTPSADGGNVWTVTTPPTSGTVVLNTNGTFTYTPATGFTGTVTFNYKVCDVDNECANAIATIRINDVPLAVNDSYTTPMNTALTGSVAGNDTASADGPNTWTVTTPPTSGTVVLNANGSFTYTPATGFTGTVTFNYQVCDVDNDCANAIATIRINDVPKAVNDSYTTPKNTPLSGTVAGNDTPSADGPNTWTVTTPPASGTVVLNTNGTFTYTPATNFTGTVTFTYKVCDANNDCATAIATIKINDAPKAVNDSYTTPKNTALSGTVATNDTPSADGPNTWTVTTPPTSGSVVLNSNGAFTYTPATGFTGTVTFTYKVCDADNDCATAIATIKINDVPVAVNDSYTTTINTAVLGHVQTNDTPSADGGNVWTVVTPSANGTVSLAGNGDFTFTPTTGFTGTTTFAYKVCDVDGDCANAIVTIVIPSVCEAGPFTTFTQGGWGASPSGNNPAQLLATNFSAVYPGGFVQIGGTKYLKFTSATAIKNFLPAGGTAAKLTSSATNPTSSNAGVFAGQVLALQLNVDFSKAGIKKRGLENQIIVGTTYTVGYALQVANDVLGGGTIPDGVSLSDLVAGIDAINSNYDNGTQDLGFLQNPPSCNAKPVAVNDSFTTAEDTPKTDVVTGNDTPSSDGGNVWTLVTGADHGTVTVTPAGGFTYTPAANYNGTDAFTYKVCDATNDCSTAVVTITITPVDDAPVAQDDAFTTSEDTPKTGVLTANDTLSGDGGNVWSLLTGPAHGTATVTSTGAFTYTPAANYNGTDTFTYQVCDADGDCDAAIVTITIAAVDDFPVAANDAFTTPKNTTVSGTLAGNDTPSGDGGNVWTRVTNSANGTATVNSNGTFSFVPTTGFTGVTTFTYKVCDTDADCSTATATITITAPDDAPVAVNDAFSTPYNTAVSGTLATNDSPSADGGNVWTRVTNSANGTATVNSNGTFTFTPTAGFSGVTTFTYKICDADNDCSTATVTITVAAAPVCTPGTFDFSGTSAAYGTAGNIRTFTAAGVSVKATAFSRVKSSGVWNTAFLGSFDGGLGVTDGSEGNGSGDQHTNDNVGDRTNYILFEFSQPVLISRAYLGYVVDDSDMSVWYGNKSNPYTNHQTLSDSLLSTLTTETNAGSSVVRWADLGSDVVAVNTLVIAAKTTEANDEFKVEKLEMACGTPPAGAALASGDTATIGFWHNGNGQALILSLNGSSNATNLGNWLATNYPYLFGAQAGSANNMTGKTNTQVAAYDLALFGSDKWLNQVLGGAIAAYVTNSTLAGSNYAVGYGFNYSATGTGAKTYNVGSNGTAIGLTNNTTYTIAQLLQQANLRKQQGTYDSNAFNVIFSDINETGDII